MCLLDNAGIPNRDLGWLKIDGSLLDVWKCPCGSDLLPFTPTFWDLEVFVFGLLGAK